MSPSECSTRRRQSGGMPPAVPVRLGKRRAALIAIPPAVALVATACGWPSQTPVEIPVGGVREGITAANLAAARDGMPGGLLEPGWLPEGFELVHAEYVKVGRQVESVDVVYENGTNYVHLWQTQLSPEELGVKDPVTKGEPIDDTGWNMNPLNAARVGREGVVEYSTRLPDGRTVTVDSDLPADVMRRILESLYLRVTDTG